MNQTVAGRVDDRLDTRNLDGPGRGVVAVGMQGDSVRWGAILVGALAAIALGAMLNVLGIAIGAAGVDATGGETPTATTYGVGTGVWLALANAVALLLGGLIAARLADTWKRSDSVLHGIGVWAVASLVSLAILGSAVSGAAVSAVRGASSAVGTVVEGAGAAGGAALQQVDPSALAERLQRAATAPADPAAMSQEQVAAEMGDLILRRVTAGEWTASERTRIQLLLAASTGVPPEQAEARLQQVEAQATEQLRQAETAVREAADTAASATALASFWAFAAMALGLAAAMLGAWLGARSDDHRDRYATAA